MASSVSVRVDKATSDLLLGPDWTLNMEICDSINSDPGLAKEVIKAVKKRLQHKIPRVQFLALTLLETMIKNCGDFIHFQVVERDILQEMVKIVRKKSDMEVREKILVLLESWQEAFGGPGGKYPQYFWAYTDLKRFGVDFPSHPSDATLMFTSPMHQAVPRRAIHVGSGMPIDSPMRLDQVMSSENTTLSLSGLDRIRSVMELLNDMLKAVNPQDPEVVKDEVIEDLVEQCRSNQKKILQLIDSTGDEELLCEGLALNDNLQNLLSKHDAIASGSPFPPESSKLLPLPPTPPPIASNNFKEEDEEDDENDEFTQLSRRNAIALPDPPPPIKTTANDQSIIDLLSISVSANSPQSHTPISPFTPSSTLNGSADLIARSAQENPESPWAGTQHSSLSQKYGGYPPPPWEDDPSRNPNPFIQSSYPMQYNSFGANSANSSSATATATATATADESSRPTGPGATHKSFVPSYRLFEDLVDDSDLNGVLRTRSSSGQGMRK